MGVPFTTEQFLSVFEKYNLSVWPVQVLLILVAIFAVFLSIRKMEGSDKIISTSLGFFWIWIGVVYHLVYFSSINKAAYLFGPLFIVQGGLFCSAGLKSTFSFKFQPNYYGSFGSVFILYALIIYPVLGYFLGHAYPKNPTFGLPCPTTIFTFGILLWTNRKIPKYVLIIPLIWSIIGFGAALSLGIKEDWGLLAAGILGFTLIFVHDRKGNLTPEESLRNASFSSKKEIYSKSRLK